MAPEAVRSLVQEPDAHLRLDDGREVELRFRHRPNARRITLSVDAETGGLNVTMPRRASRSVALDFAKSKAGWILGRLSALPPRQAFRDGMEITILGVPHRLRHCPEKKGLVGRAHDEIHIPGEVALSSGRLLRWLKSEARRECVDRATAKARLIEKQVREVAVRDTKSRWGSCAPDGRLMFCWRLILAPDFVFDYVIAHEVAHLVYAGHGPRFWALTARLTADVPGARAWLRRQGAGLHRIG